MPIFARGRTDKFTQTFKHIVDWYSQAPGLKGPASIHFTNTSEGRLQVPETAFFVPERKNEFTIVFNFEKKMHKCLPRQEDFHDIIC